MSTPGRSGLRPGNLIFVTLRDRKVAAFRVYSVALYRKSAFPTATVYRYTRRPTLRLVTCGGAFDRRTHHYLGNIVVFAKFVGAGGSTASGRRISTSGAARTGGSGQYVVVGEADKTLSFHLG
jgi:hypothetical protein